MRPTFALLTSVFCIIAIVAIVALFRWDTALSPNGSSVSRDRLTGDILVCNARNACELRASTKLILTTDWRNLEFKDALSRLEHEAEEERQQAADASRSKKGGPRRVLDTGVAFGAGTAELIMDTFTWLFGPPTYEPLEQWTRIWKTRNELWRTIDIFKRESLQNRVASYIGYYLPIILSIAWVIYITRRPIQRWRKMLADRWSGPSIEPPKS